MAFAKITQVAHYVPSQQVTNDDLAQIMETSDEWIRSRTGIKTRYLSYDENTSQLATKVAESLLAKANLAPEALDFIIVATMTPDSSMPSTAALVQGNIGASRAFAFDLTAACSGFVFALATAEKFIRSGQYQKGLVIGAEVLSKTLDFHDRSTAVLFGDGAGGILLEVSSSSHFLAESLHSDGTRSESLQAGDRFLEGPFAKVESGSDRLRMDGRRVFDFVVRDVSKSIKALLEETGISPDQIDYALFHQANSRLLDKMAQKIGLERRKVLSNLDRYGNTSAASIPILLSEAVEDGQIYLDGSQQILLSGFGGGLTWGSLIVTI